MRCIILAAGRGSRMKSLTDDRPKCLLEFRGKPLLEWQLFALQSAGIKEIGIVTGYRRELLCGWGLHEFHNKRWAETNMVSSLECACQWLNDAPCIVTYSDIFYGVDAVRSLMACMAELGVAYDPNWLELWTRRFGNPLLDAEAFRITHNQILLEIGNKPKAIEEIEGQYMGLLKISPKGWAEIARIREILTQQQRDGMHMTGTLQMVIEARRMPIAAVPYTGIWGEIDSAFDLAAYQQI